MAGEAKQREWIWEFFLKNCSDERMFQELIIALPFPTDNLDLRKKFLLRTLSLQVSKGIVDENTLEMLRNLGEVRRFLEAGTEGSPANGIDPGSSTLPKQWRGEKKDDGASRFDEAAHITFPQEPAALPMDLENQSFSDDDGKRSESVGIRDWMQGRALPRSIGGLRRVDQEKEASQGIGPRNSGARNIIGDEILLGAGHSAKQWELELVVMAELTVKHLRQLHMDAASLDSFEQAISRYWSDSLDDAETWDDADREEIVNARDQIRNEFCSLKTNSELVEKVVRKYTKDRVEDILKTYLDKELSTIGQTFLERVSSDVVNGHYNPPNGSNHRPPKVTANISEDAGFGRESGSRTHTIEKPCVRASRGKFSRSREKSQKKFTIWDLDDNAEDGDLRSGRKGHEERDTSKTGRHGDSTLVTPSAEGKRQIDARARRLGLTGDGGIARVLEFEEPGEESSLDNREGQKGARTGVADTASEGHPDLKNAALLIASEMHALKPSGNSPANCGKLNTGMLRPSDAVCGPIAEEPETEDQIKETSHSTRIDRGNSELKSHVETVDKENILLPSPGEPMYQNRNIAEEPEKMETEDQIEETNQVTRIDCGNAEPKSQGEKGDEENVGPSLPGEPLDPNQSIAEKPEKMETEDQIKETGHLARTDSGNAELKSHVEIAGRENIVPPLPGEPLDQNIAEEPEKMQTEDQIKEVGHTAPTDGRTAELKSHVETVDKENIVPPLPGEPLDPNQNATGFNPPPWVTGSPASLDTGREPAGLTRKRKSGLSVDKASAATQESLRTGEVDMDENYTTEEHGTTRTQRNLEKKQTALDAAAKDPLSNILPSSRTTQSILERNSSARTIRWDEDDIETEPDTPSASTRPVPHSAAEQRKSPLVSAITVKGTSSFPSGSANAGKQGRRKPRRWSEREVSSLKEQVAKFGKGRWKFILERNLEIFEGRTEVDLKDKWRNLERFEGICE